ncbi:hypothetical protein ACLOAV_000226 [Pseudogymnoascus australis]
MEGPADGTGTLPRAPFDGTSKSQADLKENFYRYFQQEVTDLQDQIDKLERTALVGGERQDAIDYCLASISRLTTEVHDALDFIPAYDQRAYTISINCLTDKFQEARAKFAPKSRFAFKIKKNESALSLQDVAAAAVITGRKEDSENHASGLSSGEPSRPAASTVQPPSKDYNAAISEDTARIRAPSFRQANPVAISDHEGLHIILPSSAAHATSSGSLTDLTKCIVDMSISTANGKPFAGLALKNITNSLIVAGQVAGATHLTNVQDTVVVVTSRQVRMHDCNNVDVYLSCMSRPIIEDCKNIRFAPIPKCYEVPSEEPVDNHWDQVDDFKWLKAEKSPNWSVLVESERLPDAIWTTVVPGKPGMAAEDILKQVGTSK